MEELINNEINNQLFNFAKEIINIFNLKKTRKDYYFTLSWLPIFYNRNGITYHEMLSSYLRRIDENAYHCFPIEPFSLKLDTNFVSSYKFSILDLPSDVLNALKLVPSLFQDTDGLLITGVTNKWFILENREIDYTLFFAQDLHFIEYFNQTMNIGTDSCFTIEELESLNQNSVFFIECITHFQFIKPIILLNKDKNK